ncbi:MAG TPA: EAL domain-containing protein [Gemmatimonadales bacterium]|nr:EAL domain-containing protein [Gemmatimonadales bacterium]
MTSSPRRTGPEAIPAALDAPSPIERVGPITVAAAVYGLAYIAWERSGWGSPTVRDIVGNVAFMPLNLTVVLLNLVAASNELLDGRVRRALRLLALGSFLVLCGNAISTYYLVGLRSNPPVSWADPFYLGDSLAIITALLSVPLSRRTKLESWKFGLDAAMVVAGGGVAIWYFTVRGTADHASDAVVILLAFAYPIASLLVLLAITTVLLRGPLDGNRRAFGLLVSGISLSVVGDLTFDLLVVETGGRTASLIDALYLLAYLLMIASAELYWREPVPADSGARHYLPRRQPLSPLPYAAVATTYALLLATAFRYWTDPLSGVAIGAVLATVLVVARQVLAVRENVRLLAETAARQNEARFRALVQHSSDVIIVVRPDGTIRFVSPSAARVLRCDPAAIEGRQISDLLYGDDGEQARTFVAEAARTPGGMHPVEWRFRQPDGSALHAEVIATNLLDEPTVRGIVLNTRDVSERKRLEQQLIHQAFHDPLTGLANRALFRDRVSHALALARRQGRAITVLFLDLDDFKTVNDTLGHAEGDRLLIAAAERFRSCARVTDTVARLGGDEFGILLEDGAGCDGADELIQRLTEAMEVPFHLGGNEIPVRASVGVATAAGDESADDLLRNADVAMYAAKRGGKGRSETYQTQMYTDLRERLELEGELRSALDRDELVLHYQPIVCLRTGAVRGVEALVRWNHPRHGLLLPQHFVPLSEESGLMLPLGWWVLREACRQAQAWRLEYPELDLSVAVNLSARQLLERDLVAGTRTALIQTGVNPGAVMLEITEGTLMQQTGSMLERLQELKDLGVRLAIDDFGTGYSSLEYLRRFPIDILKIARPFVADVGAGIEKAALARAIVGLGDTLKLRTVAEGIETAEQRAALTVLGCELGQGHYFAPALPPDRLELFLDQAAQQREDAELQGPAAWVMAGMLR